MGSDGRRRSIRLGKVNAKQAESLKLKVETIAASVASKLPLDSETAAWLGNIGDDLTNKLVAVGLIPARQSARLGGFLTAYLKRREADAKPATITHMGTMRNAPIFAALRPHLEDAFELAQEGEVSVVGSKQGEIYRAASHGKNGWVGCNIRTTFEKIVRRAGLEQWPRLFHNLRASCETDLVHEHPIHAVCSWIGNTPAIANRHYLQVLDSDFKKAAQGGANSGAVVVQNAVQTESTVNGQTATHRAGTLENLASCPVTAAAARLCTAVQMGPAGLEPATNPL